MQRDGLICPPEGTGSRSIEQLLYRIVYLVRPPEAIGGRSRKPGIGLCNVNDGVEVSRWTTRADYGGIRAVVDINDR